MAALLIERLLKVVTPELAVWVSVPERVPRSGVVADRDRDGGRVVGGLDVAERVLDCDLDARAESAPALALVGWVVKTSWAAAPATTLKGLLVAVPCAGLLVALSV